jgi:hypothetical protein
MKQSTKYTIHSPYVKNLLRELGFKGYPYTLLGLLFGLNRLGGIDLSIIPNEDVTSFTWVGYDRYECDIFSQDFTSYASMEEALEAGLVESICYLSLKQKNNE